MVARIGKSKKVKKGKEDNEAMNFTKATEFITGEMKNKKGKTGKEDKRRKKKTNS